MDKYYNILNISPTSDLETVKKAYKKLAIKYHPDKNPDSDTSEKFKEITNAYQKIVNPNKSDSVNMDEMFADIFNNFGMNGMNGMGVSNIFDMFGESHFENPNFKKGQDIFKSINVNLSDIYNENIIKIEYENRIINKNYKQCKNCNGLGHVVNMQQLGPIVMQARNKCQYCDSGFTNLYNDITDVYNLKLSKIHDINKKIIVQEKGLPLYDGISGDLIIKININNHLHNESNQNSFKVKNYNLYQNLSISFKESLLGFSRSIILPDNRIIKVESNTPINNDTIKYLENEGLYSDDIKDFGSIILKIKVLLPTNLTDEQINIINKYFD
jgi:DnaJ-class molecular chaperone